MADRQIKTIQWTINLPMDFPSDWDDDMIEFHLNESSWCCNNLISEIEKYDKKNGCICGICEAKVVGQIGGANKLPTKYDLGGGNLTLFDATTGKELSNLDNVHLDSCEVEKGTQFGNWMRQNASITMDFTTDEKVDINKILGMDIAQMQDSYDIQYIKIVQVRKHKKKRINKKWLKRYGYKKVIVNSKGWNVKTHADGTVEFVK